VEESGLVFDEWVPVDHTNLKTKIPQVYAIGDVSSAGVPKSGQFARSAAETAAESILEEFHGRELSDPFQGKSICYVEFGYGNVARADVDFFSKHVATGYHRKASPELSKEKKHLETGLLSRWFDMYPTGDSKG
jgi:sulfide:quinone oxidoreductase